MSGTVEGNDHAGVRVSAAARPPDYGLGYAAGAREELGQLAAILRQGETVRCAATAFFNGRPGLVAATTGRLLFVRRGQTPINVPYSDITRFRAKVGVLTSDLEVEVASRRAVLRQIHPRHRLADLVGVLQGEPASLDRTLPVTASQSSPESADPAGRPRPGGKKRSKAAPPRAPSARRREPVPLPPGGWLEPGEWLVTTFSGIDAELGKGRKLVGNAAVTNRRLLLLERTGFTAADWLLDEVRPEQSGSTMRVRLTPTVDFGFASADSAAEFIKAVVTAGFLAGPQPGSPGGGGN
ncbi:MAG: PH domain-containing protein [Acidimicrobiales bacterium]